MSSSLEMLKDAEGQTNAVFACFGSAAQHSQFFEVALGKFLIVYNTICNSSSSLEDLESYDATLQKKTMGHLLTNLKGVVTFGDNDIELKLEDTLAKRNFLMHHFFRERNHQLASEQGRFEMMQDLLDIERALDTSRTMVNAMRIAMCETLRIVDPYRSDYES